MGDEANTDEVALVSKWCEIIEDLLNKGMTCYLSSVGNRLGPEDRAKSAALAGSLLAFVPRFLADRYHLVRSGIHSNIHTIVRGRRDDLAELGSVVLKRMPKIPRYHRSFWAAFSIPLEEGQARAIDVTSFQFRTVPSADLKLSESERHIPAEKIASGEADMDRDERIVRNIKDWLAENKLNESDFLVGRVATARARIAERSLLEVMFMALDKQQLRSTSLSLDVVEALLKHKI